MLEYWSTGVLVTEPPPTSRPHPIPVRHDSNTSLLHFCITLAAIAWCLTATWSLSALAAETRARGVEAGARQITVAVVDFDSRVAAPTDLGRRIAAAAVQAIVRRGGFAVVPRERVRKAMTRMKLNAAAAVNTKTALKIAKSLGVAVIVVGRAAPYGKRVLVNAKIIARDGRKIEAVAVRTNADRVVKQVADRVARRLAEVAADFASADAPTDSLQALKRDLAGRVRPRTAVLIYEGPGGFAEIRRTNAAQGEVTRTLRDAGLRIADVRGRGLARWARSALEGAPRPWPKEMARSDVAVVGHAVAVVVDASRRKVDCTVTLDVVLVARSGGRPTFKRRATGRARAENSSTATRLAATRAARSAGIEVLKHMVKTLPKKEPEKRRRREQ